MLAMNQCEWTWAEEVHEQWLDAIVFGFVLCAVRMVATEPPRQPTVRRCAHDALLAWLCLLTARRL